MPLFFAFFSLVQRDNGGVAHCPIPVMKPENTNVLNHIVCARVGQWATPPLSAALPSERILGFGFVADRELEIAAKLGFLDLHLKRAMNEVREGPRVADEMLHDRLIALADEVVQECARIEFAQELDILFG